MRKKAPRTEVPLPHDLPRFREDLIAVGRDFENASRLAETVFAISNAPSDHEAVVGIKAHFREKYEKNLDLYYSFIKIPHPRDGMQDYVDRLNRVADWQADFAKTAMRIASIQILHSALDRLVLSLISMDWALNREERAERYRNKKVPFGLVLDGRSDEALLNLVVEDLREVEDMMLHKKLELAYQVFPPIDELISDKRVLNTQPVEQFHQLRVDAVHRLEIKLDDAALEKLWGLNKSIGLLCMMFAGYKYDMYNEALESLTSKDDPFMSNNDWMKPYIDDLLDGV